MSPAEPAEAREAHGDAHIPATPPPAGDTPRPPADAARAQELLAEARAAIEAAEARASHSAAQVRRLTEELTAARAERLQTLARLRAAEDRLAALEGPQAAAATPASEAADGAPENKLEAALAAWGSGEVDALAGRAPVDEPADADDAHPFDEPPEEAQDLEQALAAWGGVQGVSAVQGIEQQLDALEEALSAWGGADEAPFPDAESRFGPVVVEEDADEAPAHEYSEPDPGAYQGEESLVEEVAPQELQDISDPFAAPEDQFAEAVTGEPSWTPETELYKPDEQEALDVASGDVVDDTSFAPEETLQTDSAEAKQGATAADEAARLELEGAETPEIAEETAREAAALGEDEVEELPPSTAEEAKGQGFQDQKPLEVLEEGMREAADQPEPEKGA